MKGHVVRAVWKRNVLSYFSGALGYLFIVVFVASGAMLAFDSRFFADNLANLDQLNARFPLLLLFIVPAVTMSAWSEEKKLGTDELLFTLPAGDVQILLGKYLAALTVYTVALLFSITHPIVLGIIGDPDWGQIFATYLGYWLAGAALIGGGMFASVLTGSATVAFVLAVVICAVPIFIGDTASTLAGLAARFGIESISVDAIRNLSVASQLRDFGLGLIPLGGVLYFVSLAGFFLYLNLVFISRRHWSADRQTAMGAQFAARTLSLAVALIGLNYVAVRSNAVFGARIDMTAGDLFTLSEPTVELLDKTAEDEQPVTIQAFISPDVPQKYVFARKQLIGLLRQYDRVGGKWIDVRIVDVAPGSKHVHEAGSFGIEPIKEQSERSGRRIEQNVYMGVVVTGSRDEVVIPFLSERAALEYELTRAVGTAIEKGERLKVGVLHTDIAADRNVRAPDDNWIFSKLTAELRRHYELVPVWTGELKDFNQPKQAEKKAETVKKTPAEGKSAKSKAGDEEPAEKTPASDNSEKPGKKSEKKDERRIDVLLVVQPSSLASDELKDVVEFIKRGTPALIFDDPLPFYRWTYDWEEVVGAPAQSRSQYLRQAAFRQMPRKTFADLAERVQRAVQSMQNLLRRMPPPRTPQEQAQRSQMMPRMIQQAADREINAFLAKNPQYRSALQPAPPKAAAGRLTPLMKALGLAWTHDEVVFQTFELHPEFALKLPRHINEQFAGQWPPVYGPPQSAVVFLSPRTGNRTTFDAEDPISAGLRELVLFHPGGVDKAGDGDTVYTPLVQTGNRSGRIKWTDLTEDVTRLVRRVDQFTGQPLPGASREPVTSQLTGNAELRLRSNPLLTFDDKVHTLAARVKGKGDSKVNAVFVADIDMITNLFFEQQEQLEHSPDNVQFVLNAIEVLAGDESFATLRNRRPQPRALTKVQAVVDRFRDERQRKQREAEAKDRKELQTLEENIEKADKELGKDRELDIMQRLQSAAQTRSTEVARYRARKRRLERELQQTKEELKAEEQRQVQSHEGAIRFWAVALPPVPAILLGLIVLGFRLANERRTIVESRRV